MERKSLLFQLTVHARQVMVGSKAIQEETDWLQEKWEDLLNWAGEEEEDQDLLLNLWVAFSRSARVSVPLDIIFIHFLLSKMHSKTISR